MKKCPFCAEEIQDAAIKCRFCGELLGKKKWWKNCFIGCLVAFLVIIILIVLSIYLGFLMLKFITYKVFFGPQRTPSYYYHPFFIPGLEDILRSFSEFFRFFGEKLREFFYSPGHRII